MKRKKVETKARTKHSAETKETARKMYLRGLYLTEISVLCGRSFADVGKVANLRKMDFAKRYPRN
jgi:hypothetical protein